MIICTGYFVNIYVKHFVLGLWVSVFHVRYTCLVLKVVIICVCGYSVCIRLYDLIVVLYVCLVYVNISVCSTV